MVFAVSFAAYFTAYAIKGKELRINQVDLKLAKGMKFGRTRIQVTAAAYNLLNTSAALIINTAYSATWLQPTNVLEGRLFKLGVQLDY